MPSWQGKVANLTQQPARDHLKLLRPGNTIVDWQAPVDQQRVAASLPAKLTIHAIGVLMRKYAQWRPGCLVVSGHYEPAVDQEGITSDVEVIAFIPGKLPARKDQPSC